MWEVECHDWDTLDGFERPKDVPRLLEKVLRSSNSNQEEWRVPLSLLEAYASDLGLPSEATKDVVACLVAVAIRSEGRKRSELLGLLAEVTSGRGVEEYNSCQLTWLRAAARELVYALHTWTQLAESSSAEDAVACAEILTNCAIYVSEIEPRVLKYLRLLAADRPELRDEIVALLATLNETKQVLSKREHV